MHVGEIMTNEVITVVPETLISEVARLLYDKNLTGMPVIEHARVVGIITEYDLMSRHDQIHIPTYLNLVKQLKIAGKTDAIEKELKLVQSLRVRDLMTTPVVTVHPDTDVAEAARLFIEHSINPLPVVNDKDELVGIVSRADIVSLFRAGVVVP